MLDAQAVAALASEIVTGAILAIAVLFVLLAIAAWRPLA